MKLSFSLFFLYKLLDLLPLLAILILNKSDG